MSETQASDPFVGKWALNIEKSRFDANHNPRSGTMVFEAEEGGYVMKAEGVAPDGRVVNERPQRFVLDGQPHPLPDFPELLAVATRPTPRALHGEVRRPDGSIVGEGDFVVSPDGLSMTATTTGFDSQLRRFQVSTAWDRIESKASPGPARSG
jgi:hypothetical protein